jgi:hypothetical protein
MEGSMVKHFNPNTEGWLYFITSSEQEACKIGFATDTYQRVKTLQTGNPEPLQLRMQIRATLGAEIALHRLLAARRIHKNLEWFWDRSDFLVCLEEHLELFALAKGEDACLTGEDVEEQFPIFMELDGRRYPDEHDPRLLAEVARYASLRDPAGLEPLSPSTTVHGE